MDILDHDQKREEEEDQHHVPNMPWVKCVHCGEQEPMVVGWTMVTRRGVLEQRCIDDF